jgi:chemotaxis protein MotA
MCGAAVKQGFKLFKPPPSRTGKLIEEFVELSQLARKEGVLGLEKVAESASHPLLRKGILMAVDGSDSEVIRSTLETAMEQDEEHATNSAKVFEAAGGYAPTVGIIGAVLGLIHVMSDLTDIEKVGQGIAVAFVATIYGVAAANIVFLPLAGRIKMIHQSSARDMDLILNGILAIQAGLNPKVVRERLAAYLPHGHKAEGKSGGAGAAAESAA